MTETLPMAGANAQINLAGLAKNDYRGNPSTLCQGCGHNSISNQIISALYEMNVVPEDVVKFSGIGCSSKSPTYFLNRSFGFNGLHGRMPSVATGALFGEHRHGPVQTHRAPQCQYGVHCRKQRRVWLDQRSILCHSRSWFATQEAGY